MAQTLWNEPLPTAVEVFRTPGYLIARFDLQNSRPALTLTYLISFIGKNLSSHLAYANGLAGESTYRARRAIESTTDSSTPVVPDFAPMVVDIDSDCACAVEAHNDAREIHAARRLQDAHFILYQRRSIIRTNQSEQAPDYL